MNDKINRKSFNIIGDKPLTRTDCIVACTLLGFGLGVLAVKVFGLP